MIKYLDEKLSLEQLRNKFFYTGNNNEHLDFFYKKRKSLMGSPNRNIKFVTSEIHYLQNSAYMDFLFRTDATPYEDENHEYYELKNAPSTNNLNSGELIKNPTKEYMMVLRIMDFYELLEYFEFSKQEDFSKENLKAILELSQYVKLSCSCPSNYWMGGQYYLSLDDASLIPCNIAPKKWNKYRPNVSVCKHLEGLLHPQTISFLLPQMAMSVKKVLIAENLIKPKSKLYK